MRREHIRQKRETKFRNLGVKKITNQSGEILYILELSLPPEFSMAA